MRTKFRVYKMFQAQKPKLHEADCRCTECKVFYSWWIRKKYNLLSEDFHNIALTAFRLGYNIHKDKINQHEKRINKLERRIK